MGVPIIRIILFWGCLYWGPPILGNYHIGLSSTGIMYGYVGIVQGYIRIIYRDHIEPVEGAQCSCLTVRPQVLNLKILQVLNQKRWKARHSSPLSKFLRVGPGNIDFSSKNAQAIPGYSLRLYIGNCRIPVAMLVISRAHIQLQRAG